MVGHEPVAEVGWCCAIVHAGPPSQLGDGIAAGRADSADGACSASRAGGAFALLRAPAWPACSAAGLVLRDGLRLAADATRLHGHRRDGLPYLFPHAVARGKSSLDELGELALERLVDEPLELGAVRPDELPNLLVDRASIHAGESTTAEI